MQNPVFKIRNLNCQYIPDQPVLEIDDLEIYGGKLLFVIGKSGIGKSTLIETLGLMNNTIGTGGNLQFDFYPTEDSSAIDLKSSWQMPNQELSEFRKQYFSFIFQNTNLMPNFTAGENMMMSLLINGYTVARAETKVRRIMQRLSLDEEVFEKKITELSGGQRQRLAFVRAVTAEFKVLFGDEPTGNLDENTARELMAVLKELIQEEGKTGIIVSHDLKLAEQFADVILPITTVEITPEKNVGKIHLKDVMHRDETRNWVNGLGQKINEPMMYLNSFLSNKSISAI